MMMNGIQPHYLSCLPLILPGTPKRDIQPPKEDPPVLNLCTRDSPPAPEYCPTAKPLESARYAHSPTSEFSDSSEVSSTDINSNSCKVKPVRPFKAYPKDPLTLSFIGAAADILNKDSSAAYEEFREKLLSQVQNCPSTNKNMRRNQSMKEVADPTYWEKRKKNNEAAKRSRDARRAKEDEIAIRCAFLEQENAQLKFRLATVEAEKKKLYEMMYR